MSLHPVKQKLLFAAFLIAGLYGSASSAYAATACGGKGERACCNFYTEYPLDGHVSPCGSGLIEIPGCDEGSGSCTCGGSNIISGIKSSGTCAKPSHCGAAGERGCCNGLTEFSNVGLDCDSGLTRVPGCAGDCTCGGAGTGQVSVNACAKFVAISEPTPNSTPMPTETSTPWTLPILTLPTGPECPATGLCGFTDLHVHMFGHMAHGGGTIAGKPYDPTGDINTALKEDYGSDLSLVDKNGNAKHIVDGNNGAPSCPNFLTDNLGNLCTNQKLFHGDHTLIDNATGGGTNDKAASNLGVPIFNGWPQFNSTIHQQVYYKWLERAWLGGMRLMVMDAVTNEALCDTSSRISGTDCSDSMSAVNAQIQAAKDFQTWLDTQYGGTGKGWFRIVYTPQDATAAIQAGKLAVILGIEVDNLFNCHYGADTNTQQKGSACSASFVQQQLQAAYTAGVRHLFPIHNFDNAYGNPAAWQDAISVGNYDSEKNWWIDSDCSGSNYGFWLNNAYEDLILQLLGFGSINLGNGYYPAGPNFASCHGGSGLTAMGQSLIQSAMNLGMVIDVDHMSINSFNQTLQLAGGNHYPGIAATHVQFFDLYTQTYSGTNNGGRHERMRTSSQLQSIKNVGGLIAVMLKDDTQDTSFSTSDSNKNFSVAYNGPAGSNYGLNNNCRYSTTEFAQAYMYGADKMGGPVALGSDFNGIAGHVGPRFGSGACGGDIQARSAQEKAKNQLAYPFTLAGFGTFDKQVTGQKTWDYNVDGLAHIGLLPDMIADLKQVGLTDTQLQPLFGSAQAYINMWSGSTPSVAASNQMTQFSQSNQNVTLSATVISPAGIVNAGSVTFTVSQNGQTVGVAVTGNVTNGTATATFVLPGNSAVGTYNILAAYSNGSPVSSENAHTLGVIAATTTTTASNANASFSTSNQNVGLTATVTSAAESTVNSGSVKFTVLLSGVTIGSPISADVTNGVANVAYALPANTAANTYQIKAEYTPGPNLAAGSDTAHSLILGAASQTINGFNNPGSQLDGAVISLSATATSGLTVTFSSNTTSICTVNGNQATMIAVGQCTLKASQAGNTNYLAATVVTQTFSVLVSDQIIGKTHVGHFAQGQTDATYSLVVTNNGSGQTNGTEVVVTDTLPPSMTATSLTGNGWTCALNTLTCRRLDVLNIGQPYPTISLVVTVSNNAPASVTNQASVSGGGEINTANDSTSDPTTINVIADVSAQVKITETGFGRNRATGLWTSTMTVTNSSASAVAGPLQVVLTGLTPGVTMANNTGLRNGMPYITVVPAGQSLAPGASVKIVIQFANPNNLFINFSPVTNLGVY